jgi:hypothetical protein
MSAAAAFGFSTFTSLVTPQIRSLERALTMRVRMKRTRPI